MNLSLEARGALSGWRESGQPVMSRREFAEVTGDTDKTIYKRDCKTIGITAAAALLYELILDLYDEGMVAQCLDRLRSVPNDERNSARAMLALFELAREHAKWEIVRRISGLEGHGEEDALDASADVTLRTLDRMKESFSRSARRAEQGPSRLFDEAAADLIMASYKYRRAVEESKRSTKETPGRDDEPEGPEPEHPGGDET